MSKRPHILIFNPDQWRGDVLGCVGNAAAATPNLDKMTQTDGVSFRSAFCQNPVCTPSRCSFMSGWYPHVRGHRTMHHMMRQGEPVLLKILKDSGYFVWWGGKNDLVPAQGGYDQFCDVKFRAAEADYKRWGYTPRNGLEGRPDWRGERGGDNYYGFFAGRLDTGGEKICCDHDWANVLGAIDFIRSAPKDRRLCIYLPLIFPHPAYKVEEPFYSMIDRGKLPPRAPTPEGWAGKPSLLKGIWEMQNMQGWTEDRWTELRAVYYGMCARLDHQFGLLCEALEAAGLYDDTAVFCFSDHGDFTGDYGLVEKTQNTFEDCLARVPFVVKPPAGVPVRPRVSDALVELVDFPATVFELTGIEPDYWHFGRSLLPVIAGETDAHRDAVFCEGGRLHGERHCMEFESTQNMADPSTSLYWPRLRLQQAEGPEHTKAVMCRTKDFKYVLRLYESDELYDLRSDPMELNNRIADQALAGVLTEMKDRMLRFFLATGDVVPTTPTAAAEPPPQPPESTPVVSF
ncbi:MAG: sulfatase-like hydrolase/transferase [Planctomycetota bacterium]|jgi:arylsulfatase A-like enzyme